MTENSEPKPDAIAQEAIDQAALLYERYLYLASLRPLPRPRVKPPSPSWGAPLTLVMNKGGGGDAILE